MVTVIVIDGIGVGEEEWDVFNLDNALKSIGGTAKDYDSEEFSLSTHDVIQLINIDSGVNSVFMCHS